MIVRVSPENRNTYYTRVPIEYDAASDGLYETALVVEEWFEENGILAESYDILDDEEAEEVEERGLLR